MYNHQAGDTSASLNSLDREQDKNGQHTAGQNDRHGTIPESLEDRLEQELSPEHLQSLREGSAIASEDILARGYFTVSDPEQLRQLGFAEYQLRAPALVIPIYGVEDGQLFYRIRPDEPREDRTRPGKVVKYEQPTGADVALDVPPRARPMLSDPSKRLWIV